MRKIGFILCGALLGAGAALSVSPGLRAFPAAEPSMLGIWTPDSYHAAARHGLFGLTEPKPMNVGTMPQQASLTTEPNMSAWALSFTSQKGGAFTGTATSPAGESVPVVGAFRSDGKRIVYSTPFGSGSGEVDGGNLEWCFTNSVATFASAECTIYHRTP